ncbi:nucleolar protein 58 [Cephus cinctus]|uniref:Nucleolar protein 58 n=1 Tax=Cephus cinctus TaxID=211228 RepID=A0AAJ7BIF3_CEPCN|nr:nucleolar protein 58 [Cephus cinctus]
MYNECCKYKRAKKITIKNCKRKKAHTVINDYDCESKEQIPQKSKRHKKSKSRLSPVPKNNLTNAENILLRIQPPMADREKYINPRHVFCFLEGLKHPCPVTPKTKPYPAKPKSRERIRAATTKQVSSNEKNKTNKEKNEKKVEENKENKNNRPNKGNKKKEQKKEKKTSSRRKNKREKDKFWCSKVTEKSTKPKESEVDENDYCKDTICSFDSEVYLAGCGLTKEDKENIEKNRQQNSRQSDKKNKNVKEDANRGKNKKRNDNTENLKEVNATNDKDSKE